MAQLIVFKQVKSVPWMIVDKEPLGIEVSARFKGGIGLAVEIQSVMK